MSKANLLQQMKSNGYRWKSLKYWQSYADSEASRRSRKRWAMYAITLLEQGFHIVNLDECGFQSSTQKLRGWVRRGPTEERKIMQRFSNVTLTAAVNSYTGNVLYTIGVGAQN